MRAQEPKRDQFETLESRHLLSASNCMHCQEEALPPDIAQTSQAEFAPAETEEGGTRLEITTAPTASASNSSTSPNTFFGPAEPIELMEGENRVAGDLKARPVYPFYFELADEADIAIRNVAGSNADFGIYSLENESIATAVNGEIDTTVEAGEYLLYVYDFTSGSSSFELRISIPESPQFIEQFPNVPYIGRGFDWNLNAVNSPEVWAQGFTGEGVIVAVLDTGVDYTHPDLDDNIFVNSGEIAGDGIDNDGNGYVDDVHGFDFAYFDADPSDVDGHGTHVAGSIAAERNGFGTTGVAYDATILPVKVLRDNGAGSSNATAAGIRYAVDVGADVINLSLGGGVTRSVVNALRYAWANDVLVVAASGNDAASRPGAPAIYSSVLSNTISVGAYTSGGNRSSFSNRVGTTSAVQIDAPGSRIASTTPGGGYRFLSGTSMATPHVSGVAALAYSANPDLRASDVRSFLVDGANRTIAGSDSAGGTNASRTVALAYQFDTFANFASTRGIASFVVSSESSFAFAASSEDIGESDFAIAAAAAAMSTNFAEPEGTARELEQPSADLRLLVHQRPAEATDWVFAQVEPSSLSLDATFPSETSETERTDALRDSVTGTGNEEDLI